jgi:hypothetical protein
MNDFLCTRYPKKMFCLSMKYRRFGYIFYFPEAITLISPGMSTQVFSLESHCKAARPALLFSLFTLSGCSLSPAIPVLGAAFPAGFSAYWAVRCYLFPAIS